MVLADVILIGLIADRPAAAIAGRLYAATDEGAVYRDTGSAWAEFVPAAGGSSGHAIQDEGVALTARAALDFVGAGVTVTDDEPNDKTIVTIPGGGSTALPFLTLLPAHNTPPATSYATLDTRNGHRVLDFDAAADESAIFTAVLPLIYGGGGLTVEIHWAATSATTGDVIWNAAIERIGIEVQDLDSDGFAAVQAVTDTAPATSGHVVVASIAFTDGAQMDSLAAGELFRLKITRDADNVLDTMTGDAELIAVVLRETP